MGDHNVYLGPPCFIVYNDANLPLDAIAPEDISPGIVTGMEQQKSEVWSADLEWFFVVMPEHITLLNIYTNKALRCRVRSAEFIRHCLDGGLLDRTLLRGARRVREKLRQETLDAG